jgi:hypothetical protein
MHGMGTVALAGWKFLTLTQRIDLSFYLQVFTFGSVLLKTYLPDGDIDVAAFGNSEELKDIWANLVRDVLEREEKSENAEFRVKEVQYIQAECCFLYGSLILSFSFCCCIDIRY